MDCGICMESNKKDIEHLICGHYLCKCCFDRLVNNICPYCRTKFVKDKECDVKDQNFDNNYTEIDNILPNTALSNIYDNNITYDIIHYNRRQVKSKYYNKERYNSPKNSFVSNRDRTFPDRKKKKWKKMRNVIEL